MRGAVTFGRTGMGLVAWVLGAGLLAGLSACKPTNQFAAPPPPKVTVANPVQQKITRYVEATGNTAPVNEVDLVARVSGFLQEIGYKDGSEVKKGDKLFVIEPRPYLAKLQQAQGQQAATQAQLKQAEAEYVRQSQLGKQDFASQSAVDVALAKRDATRADLTVAEASVEQAAIEYTYTQVNAPFDGVATAHLVSTGEYVGGTTPTKLATVIQMDPIWVNFTLSETDVQRIRESLAKRKVKIDPVGVVPVEIGLQTEQGYPRKGLIDYVAPNIDASTGTLAVRGSFKNPEMTLLPGYFVRVRVPIERDVDAMLVPDVALGADQQGRYVLVVNGEGVVEQRRVTIGDRVEEMRVIESGLTAADKVVVAGVQRAVPGQKVVAETAPAKTAAR
ncbi:MAG: efflux RND transporter periplasmic adaptor subunit [Acetobacteraceae bacterium]